MSLALVQLAAERVRELRARVGPYNTPDLPGDASHATLVNALRASELDMLVTLMLIPEQERATRVVCGTWTVKDVLGHLADWDDYFFDAIIDLEGGAAKKRHWVDDIEAMNFTLATMRSDHSSSQNWDDFRKSRLLLMDTLERIHPSRFMQPIQGAHYPTLYHLGWSALEHYMDHATGIRRTLGLALPERLLTFSGPYT
jgi:hypothetical protein